ncbi:MAG: hypothetical protein PF439_12935 [Helicobacteraceae bacterium]|jgi:hypothetical protein|nr:hypothetical protein [Helicobacteraceae bacterium]
MKNILFFFFLLTALHADTFIDKLKEGNVSGLQDSLKDNRQIESEEQKRLRFITEQPKPAVDGIAVKLFSIDVDKNSSIGIEYAPPLKQGEIIDNKEQTTIKFEHKF